MRVLRRFKGLAYSIISIKLSTFVVAASAFITVKKFRRSQCAQQSADDLARAWHRTFGLPIVVTRCSNNFGPYQFPEKLIPHMIISALQGKELPIYGEGAQIRDWLYVDDHECALLLVAANAAAGETYNFAVGRTKRNVDVVESICEKLELMQPGKPDGVVHYRDLIQFVQDRLGHDSLYDINSTKLEHALGWRPQETFETGLRKMVTWYLVNHNWWSVVLDGSDRLRRIGRLKTNHGFLS